MIVNFNRPLIEHADFTNEAGAHRARREMEQALRNSLKRVKSEGSRKVTVVA